MKKFYYALASLALAGCAVTSMQARLAPNIQTTASAIGAGRTIGLVVSDERTEKDLGQRSPMGGNIKFDGDMAAIVQTAVTEGLRKKGFTVVPGSTTGNALRIEVRGLEYKVKAGWWTGTTTVSAAIKSTARNSHDAYDQFYRSTDKDKVVFIPGAKDNNAQLNAALESVISQLLADQKLLETLAAST